MFKKLFFILVLIAVMASPAFAGFNWGVDTYSSVSNILIINSLGDQTTPSTFGALGTNDWIPENAVKNDLYMDGYTVANDFNPSITNPQFSSSYNVPVPVGYTKLQFAGKLGDPRQLQDVYVKTSEYNRLNDAQQAIRMDGIDTTISTETTNRINGDTTLQNNIDTETTNRINGDDTLQSNIDDEATTRAKADKKEKKARIAGDKKLQTNLDTETDDRIQGDIDETESRVSGDNNLQNNINNTNSRIDDTNSRVRDLEKTQTIVGAEVRVYDSKKWTVTTFADYTTTRNTVDRAGVRFTYKMGKSYEEKRADELEARLNKLEGIQNEKENLSNSTMYTTANGMGIRSNF